MSAKKILSKPLPRHIAIILDGNGRWAKKRGLPRKMGHRQGAINLKDIALLCDEIGIEALTVYCFSTENWNRPKDEVDYLMSAPVEYYLKYKEQVLATNLRISFIGRRDRFPKDFLDCALEVEEKTKNNKGCHLVIAADYGSRYEITDVVKQIASKCVNNEMKVSDITEETIDSMLYTKDLPPLDLLIRTSGEIRISNFLLWQLSYSELYFTKKYWPSFDKKELFKALDSYQHRNRRFGGLKEEKK